jgi:SAM-dependent methyltransferase
MNTPPKLTDTVALAMRRTRCTNDALFLHQTAAAEMQDRVELVNKSFRAARIITDHAAFWAGQFPDATLTDASEVIDLTPHTHDLTIHAMALHWANDPVGQLIQCRHALRADGLFLAVCFGGQTLHELRTCLAEAEVSVTGGLSPRIAPMAELRDMGALLQRAGFALPVADAITLNVEYRDIWHLMRDLRQMGEGNAMQTRLRHPTRRDVFKEAAKLYQQNYAGQNGKIRATFELIFLTGWAPDESQPKPLRPGSAQHRLAKALGTSETKLPD